MLLRKMYLVIIVLARLVGKLSGIVHRKQMFFGSCFPKTLVEKPLSS